VKFHGNIQIPQLSSKFHGLRKTVGPSDHMALDTGKWLTLTPARETSTQYTYPRGMEG